MMGADKHMVKFDQVTLKIGYYGHQNQSPVSPILMMYPFEFDCNQPICLLDRDTDKAQTSYTNANTDANRIRNKNNMSPTPISPMVRETLS